MSIIKVFEYERLSVDDNRFTHAQFDSLVKFNERNKNKYFTVVHKGIRFANYVGVIQIGKLTLEILPKADRETDTDDALKEKWHSVLIEMLKTCKLIDLESLTNATLRTSKTSILDIYLNLFLSECETLLHQGLVKKYRQETKNINALKGALHFSGHIKHNLVHQERFFTRHQTYDFEHLLNHILKEAIQICCLISCNSNIIGKSKALQLHFPEITQRKIAAKDFKRIKFDRKSARYEKAIALAKLILLNFNPDLRNGELNVLALLFDMNKLFEEYVYRVLKKDEVANSYTVSRQSSKDFWEDKRIRPDIVLQQGNETFILDTKWKVLEEATPSDDDLKQMYVYNLYFNSVKSILIYPDVWNLDNKYGCFQLQHRFEGKEEKEQHKCGVGFIKLVDINNNRNSFLRKDVPEQLKKMIDNFA
jgi:5-methylcytosine-specific restriction enzyme subunit McrC